MPTNTIARRAMSACAIQCFALAGATAVHAQTAIPVRELRNTVSSDTSVLMGLSSVRHLPNGSVLVNDPTKRQLVLFDSTLRNFKVIADTSSNSPNSYGLRPSVGGLIPYVADSSLFIDSESQAFLVIDPQGEFKRVMAPTRASDLTFISSAQFGGAGFDSKGRLIYRSARRTPQQSMGFGMPVAGKPTFIPQADSAPIMRMDLDRRSVDTVVFMKSAVARQAIVGNSQSISIRSVINPVPAGDDWTLTPDGVIAIVRAQDYHIDWIAPDGRMSSTPKMPFDWKRITPEEKQQIIDSVRKAEADRVAKLPPPGPAVPGVFVAPPVQVLTVDANELPDFYPPVRQGQVRSDREGNIWILPSTTVGATGAGLRYDVVNREGLIIERVQLPKGRTLVGFGPNGTIYMHFVKTPAIAAIERAEVAR